MTETCNLKEKPLQVYHLMLVMLVNEQSLEFQFYGHNIQTVCEELMQTWLYIKYKQINMKVCLFIKVKTYFIHN